MTTQIILKNGNIMVKELKRTKEEEINPAGLYIPENTLEDEQVSQGTVVRSNNSEYNTGDVLLFHKVMPVDVNMKIDDDKGLQQYFFIKDSDIICRILNIK
mgnify:FL=1